MRRFAVNAGLVLCLACGLGLVGCNQAQDDSESTSVSAETATESTHEVDEVIVSESDSESKTGDSEGSRITAIVEDDYKSLYEKSFTVRDEIMQQVAEVKAQANDDDNVSSIYETFDENNYYSDTGYEHYADGFIDNCIDVFAADTVSFEELADIAAKNGMYIISYMADINVAQFRIDTEVFETKDDAKQKAADIVASSDGKVENAFPSYLMGLSYD